MFVCINCIGLIDLETTEPIGTKYRTNISWDSGKFSLHPHPLYVTI